MPRPPPSDEDGDRGPPADGTPAGRAHRGAGRRPALRRFPYREDPGPAGTDLTVHDPEGFSRGAMENPSGSWKYRVVGPQRGWLRVIGRARQTIRRAFRRGRPRAAAARSVPDGFYYQSC